MKNMYSILSYKINEEVTRNNIHTIDVPNYYNFSEMLDNFLSIVNERRSLRLLNPDSINVICTTYENYNIAKKKGYNTFYIYDLMDFTDDYYYLLKSIPSCIFNIIESINNIPSKVLLRFSELLGNSSYIYMFFDSMIPRRYMDEKDNEFIHDYLKIQHMDTIPSSSRANYSPPIMSLINKLRQKKNNVKDAMVYKNSDPRLEVYEIDKFPLSEVDVTSPIITPHISLMKDLNISIRRYLGVIDYSDEFRPAINEYIVSHGFSVAIVDKKEVLLPIGYRLKVLDVEVFNNNNDTYYLITFDYTYPNKDVSKATVKISRSYIEYLVTNQTTTNHNPDSYNYFFGYSIPANQSLDIKYDNATILYDYTTSMDKRDLYTSLLCVRNTCRLFYSINKKISIEE